MKKKKLFQFYVIREFFVFYLFESSTITTSLVHVCVAWNDKLTRETFTYRQRAVISCLLFISPVTFRHRELCKLIRDTVTSTGTIKRPPCHWVNSWLKSTTMPTASNLSPKNISCFGGSDNDFIYESWKCFSPDSRELITKIKCWSIN